MQSKLVCITRESAFIIIDALNLAKIHYSRFDNGLFTDETILNRLDDLDRIQTKLMNTFNPDRKKNSDY